MFWARVHAPEARGVDPSPAEMDGAARVLVRDGRLVHARRREIGRQGAVVACELLETYWQEQRQGDDGEDCPIAQRVSQRVAKI